MLKNTLDGGPSGWDVMYGGLPIIFMLERGVIKKLDVDLFARNGLVYHPICELLYLRMT